MFVLRLLLIMCVGVSWSFTFPEDRNYCAEGYVEFDAQVKSDDSGAIAPPEAPPIYNSLLGSVNTLFLDFDGHVENHPFWGSITAAEATYNQSQYLRLLNFTAEFFRPWDVNITTDSTVYFSTSPDQRLRVVITPSNVVGGSGQAQAWSFADSAGASAFVETPGKNINAVAATIVHEIGHGLGLKHDGTAGGGFSYPYHQTANWAPIMGSTTENIDFQWNNGDYLEANNFEDDMLIISREPNNISFRSDQQGGDLSSAGELRVTGQSIADTSGIIEFHTDVDAWKFKTGGGAVALQVSSYGNYAVLEPEAQLVHIETGDSYELTGGRSGVSFSGSLAAGNYILRVASGTFFTSPSEGPSNYGSVGTYSISGSIANYETNDAISVIPVVELSSPSTLNAQSKAGDSLAIEFSVSYSGDYDVYLFVNGTPQSLSDVGGGKWVFFESFFATDQIDALVVIETNGQWFEYEFPIQVSVENLKPILPDDIQVIDFSSEFPENRWLAVGTALAEYAVDGQRETSWSAGPDSLFVTYEANGVDTLFVDVISFEPFPHSIDLSFDQTYPLAGLEIQGRETIIDVIPDSVSVEVFRGGSFQEVGSYKLKRGNRFFILFDGEVDDYLSSQLRLTVHRTFSGRESMGLAEIVPLYYVDDESTSTLSLQSQVNSMSQLSLNFGEIITPEKLGLESQEWRLFNLEGQLLFEQSVVPSSELSPGRYFILADNQRIILNLNP